MVKIYFILNTDNQCVKLSYEVINFNVFYEDQIVHFPLGIFKVKTILATIWHLFLQLFLNEFD